MLEADILLAWTDDGSGARQPGPSSGGAAARWRGGAAAGRAAAPPPPARRAGAAPGRAGGRREGGGVAGAGGGAVTARPAAAPPRRRAAAPPLPGPATIRSFSGEGSISVPSPVKEITFEKRGRAQEQSTLCAAHVTAIGYRPALR
jgi:hypothetical protein